MLHQLSRPVSYKEKSIQIGRWNGSGRGNYSTRWLKGQKSRTWFSQQPGFEWGQTPLHMRLPKSRGFKRHFKLINHVVAINVSTLNTDDRITTNDTVSVEVLYALGYGKSGHSFKILWNGEITKALKIDGIVLSENAKKLIKDAGGSIVG
jgi:large subunit ribosomal protein L15